MFLTFCFVAGIYVVWKRFSLCSSRLGYTGRSAQPIRLNEPYCMHVSIMLFCPDILRLINIKSYTFIFTFNAYSVWYNVYMTQLMFSHRTKIQSIHQQYQHCFNPLKYQQTDQLSFSDGFFVRHPFVHG